MMMLLINFVMFYLSVTVCFWYFLYQTINNLEYLSVANFKDSKKRSEIKNEIIQVKKDKKEAYKWPKFVYEIIKFEYKEYKKLKKINEQDKINNTEVNKDSWI